jgi:hypothetical protein
LVVLRTAAIESECKVAFRKSSRKVAGLLVAVAWSVIGCGTPFDTTTESASVAAAPSRPESPPLGPMVSDPRFNGAAIQACTDPAMSNGAPWKVVLQDRRTRDSALVVLSSGNEAVGCLLVTEADGQIRAIATVGGNGTTKGSRAIYAPLEAGGMLFGFVSPEVARVEIVLEHHRVEASVARGYYAAYWDQKEAPAALVEYDRAGVVVIQDDISSLSSGP